jgi:hypothetical protein
VNQPLIRLSPPDSPDERNAHDLCRRAHGFFTDPTNFAGRKTYLHQILRTKKRGTRAAPIRRALGKGEYSPDQLDTNEKERRVEVAADLFRLLAWLMLRCNWRTGEVGDYREGRTHFPSRATIADRAGFTVRVAEGADGRRRVRVPRGDRRLQDLIAAGFVLRIQVDGRPSELKIRRQAWEVCGLVVARARYLERNETRGRQARADRRKALRQGRTPRDRPAAAAVQVVATLASQADDRRRSTDPYAVASAAARGWPPDDDPPPT